MTDSSKLIDLCEGLSVSLTPRKADHCLQYLDLLLEAGKNLNLSSIKEKDQAIHKHLVDSLTVLSLLKLPKTGSGLWIDLGSGGGLPGIPLAIACPEKKIVLIEATGKKCVFLNQCVKDLKLENKISVKNGRAEDLAHKDLREKCEAVFVKAVAEIRVLLELGLPFLTEDGVLVMYKGPNVDEELKKAAKALHMLNAELIEKKEVTLPEEGGKRNLLVFKRKGKVPSMYPRKPGTPGKKPL